MSRSFFCAILRHHKRPHISFVAVLALFSLLLLTMDASAAPSSPPRTGKISAIRSGERFYRGKTITIISYGAVGTNVDSWARLLAPYIGAFLHATVNVEDISAAASIAGQDASVGASPDGLTIGQINPIIDVSLALTNTPGLNFNPERLVFLGGPPSAASVWIASPTSPYHSWSDIEHATTPVSIADVTSGVINVDIRVVDGIFGIDANVIQAYSSPTQAETGFIRGDTSLMESSLSQLGSLILADQAVPLLLTNRLGVSATLLAQLNGIPTIAQAARLDPPKTKQRKLALETLMDLLNFASPEFVAPTKTPPDRVLAMQAAIKAAIENSTVKAEARSQSLANGYSTPHTGKEQYIQALQLGKTIAPFLNS